MVGVAKAVGAQSAVLNSGPEATKARFMSTALSTFKVIHLATHALAADETAAYLAAAEPAIVFGGAERGGKIQDSLLLTSEIATLDLDADWVVLSACNTAAGLRGDSEPLSGLARAFLFAGARRLLVSNWQVASHSAARLVSDTVSAMAARKRIYPAEALQDAMLSLLRDKSKAENSYPWHWASFSIVGVSASNSD
jgi:CHAT domain-containing protein